MLDTMMVQDSSFARIKPDGYGTMILVPGAT